MSKYDWEKGNIKIPSAEWASLKKKVRNAYNKVQENYYQIGGKIWKEIKENGVSFRDAFEKHAPNSSSSTLPDGCRTFLRRAIYRNSENREKAYKPRRKDFPKKTNRDTSFSLRECEGSIYFNNDSRIVRWVVHENNHAVDQARRHPVAKAFFKALNRIDWTRDSGGKIVGNDEYNRHANQDRPGGGGNYVNSRFGPRGKRVERRRSL